MSSKEKNFGTYKIGTIVTLKSNHLKSKEQFQEILLAGEPNFITPLMIVSEILKIKTDKIDEETGVIKNLKGNYQYKCIWFSSKSFKIEEQWFYENELIHIVNNEESKNIDSESQKFSFGDNLVLKTNRLELQKRKTYLELEKDKTTNKISSLLTFCSPVFILVGYSSVNQKEPLIDNHTGKQKREYCTKLVKVKSFNVKEDKYSEFLIPIEAVEKIELPPKDLLDGISKIINTNIKGDTKKYYSVEIEEENIIFSPLNLISISNSYTLEGENIFNQKRLSIALKTNKLNVFEFPFHVDFYPDIKEINGQFLVKSILEYLQEDQSEHLRLNYMNIFNNKDLQLKSVLNTDSELLIYKIGYKNKLEKYTNRFIIPLNLIEVKNNINDDDFTYYLKAFCLLRNDYRFFKIERMQYLEIHETKELVEVAFKIWFNFLNL
jgi:hypothetical protein